MDARFDCALRRIDEANARDPNRELDDGTDQPAALLYGRRMSLWLDRLRPDASGELQIAARGQHIRRWEVPRSNYPMDRAGYFKWRTTLYGFHADRLEEIMRECGYGPDAMERVRSIVQKKRLKADPDTQSLEDAAALVFLEFHAAEFANRPDMTEQKLTGILRKTFAKMSPAGHEAARHLSLPSHVRRLVGEALAREG
jgi:hypothetical protein